MSTIRSVRNDLPPCFQPVYSDSFRYFNSVQSTVFPTAFESDLNMVVSAPTGAGKTGVLELAILRLMTRHMDPAGNFNLQAGAVKAIYLAPTRALVQERTRDWDKRFGGTLGLTCREITGDSEDIANLDTADIICITPEKFDALTRKHKDQGGMRFFGEIGLVLIDEVHLLGENRGAALEAGCISRIRVVAQTHGMQHLAIAKARFVAVSATIPNVTDIAAWLHVPPAGLHVFGQEHRPCKLQTIVRGYNMPHKDYLFEPRLREYLFGIIREFSQGKPTLIFCSSRKGTSDTALHLFKDAQRHNGHCGFAGSRQQADCLAAAFVRVTDKHLQQITDELLEQVLVAGIGFHSAGLEQSDRAIVEQLFLDGHLPVLCTTSTLALGVNLPAHLVVIMSTRRWSKEGTDVAGYKEYDRTTCLQMIGRAGRPQFDTEGVAVIMTDIRNVPRYQALSAGAEPVESQLQTSLVEYLNAEISLQTVRDLPQALQWLKTTFLAIRAGRNPSLYGIKPGETLDAQLENRLLGAIGSLVQHGLPIVTALLVQAAVLHHCLQVKQDDNGFALEAQVPGQLMAQTYTRFKTMANIVNASEHLDMYGLLLVLAKSEELSHIHIRRGQKMVLNHINQRKHNNEVQYHVPEEGRSDKPCKAIKTAAEKIVILVNEALSDKPAGQLDHSMRMETDQILHIGQRITLCMARYFAHVKRFEETGNALMLHKALRQRMWSGSALYCRQLPGIGKLLAERLAAAQCSSLHALAALDARRIEALTQRNYPFGNQVKAELETVMPPLMELSIAEIGRRGRAADIELCVKRMDEGPSAAPATANVPAARKSFYRLLAGITYSNELLLHESLVAEQFPSPLTFRCTVHLPSGTNSLEVKVSLMHERLLGLDTNTGMILQHGTPGKQHGHGRAAACITNEQQSLMESAFNSTSHAPAAERQPRQMKMSEVLAHKPAGRSAQPSATPVPLTPEGRLATAVGRREPLSSSTNRAERRAAPPPAPPTAQSASIFDMLSFGVEHATERNGDGQDSCDQGSVLTARPEPAPAHDPLAAPAAQAKPPSIFSHAGSSEHPGARRNTPRQFAHRHGAAALSEQPHAGHEPVRKPDFSRFQCGAAPLPPRNQLPGTSPATRNQIATMQRGLLNPRGGPEPSHTGTPDAGIRFLDIVRSKARKLSPSGVAVFTGDGSGTVSIAAQRATLLTPSQPLPGMSQRLVASRLMAPSPIPRARLFARDQTPDTKVAHPGGFGSGGDGHAAAEELDEDAEELRLPGLGTLSPPGPVVRSHAVHKRPGSFQGSAAAEHRPVQDSSSWHLLQAGGSQARSQKALFNVSSIGDEWSPSIPQSHSEAAGGEANSDNCINLAEPTQLRMSHRSEVADALSGHQQQPAQKSSLVSSLRAAYLPTSANSALADSGPYKPDQSAAPASELSSVFDFL